MKGKGGGKTNKWGLTSVWDSLAHDPAALEALADYVLVAAHFDACSGILDCVELKRVGLVVG